MNNAAVTLRLVPGSAEFQAVWAALQQFIDNHDDVDFECEREAEMLKSMGITKGAVIAAQSIQDKLDAAMMG